MITKFGSFKNVIPLYKHNLFIYSKINWNKFYTRLNIEKKYNRIISELFLPLPIFYNLNIHKTVSCNEEE